MKAIVYEDGELLTLEAQNALLKVLEEPPEHTIIIIATTNKDVILETIQSRCAIIELPQDEEGDYEKDLQNQFIDNASHLNTTLALEIAQAYDKAKEGTQKALERTIIILHTRIRMNDLHAERLLYYAHILQRLQNAYTTITTTNANKRLTLETTFLSMVE